MDRVADKVIQKYHASTCGQFCYAYGSSLDVATFGKPAALGGRGDVVGSSNNAGFLFLAAYCNWKF